MGNYFNITDITKMTTLDLSKVNASNITLYMPTIDAMYAKGLINDADLKYFATLYSRTLRAEFEARQDAGDPPILDLSYQNKRVVWPKPEANAVRIAGLDIPFWLLASVGGLMLVLALD